MTKYHDYNAPLRKELTEVFDKPLSKHIISICGAGHMPMNGGDGRPYAYGRCNVKYLHAFTMVNAFSISTTAKLFLANQEFLELGGQVPPEPKDIVRMSGECHG